MRCKHVLLLLLIVSIVAKFSDDICRGTRKNLIMVGNALNTSPQVEALF
jgi:hypothetical protein